MKKSILLTAALCGAAAFNAHAAGALPFEGNWKHAYAHGVNGMVADGNAVVDFKFLPNYGKHQTYAAERLLDVPFEGDFTAQCKLIFDLIDGNFIGNGILQLIDENNQVMAQCGLRDHWVGAGGIIFAQTEKTPAARKVALPFKGELDIRIDRQGDNCTIYGNSMKIMEGKVSTLKVAKLRLFFDTYKGGAGHFGRLEFKDLAIGALNLQQPQIAAKTFVEEPRSGMASDWMVSVKSGFKTLETEALDDALSFKGFTGADNKARYCNYILDRQLGELGGDFTASLDLRWQSPANGMGEVYIQLFNGKSELVAETGVIDGWLTGSPRVAGWVGPGRKGAAFWLPAQGDERFVITRKGNIITVHCGHWKIDEQSVSAIDPVTMIRLVVRQNLAFDKDNTTLLSDFGNFQLKRIEVADKALPLPEPRVKPVDRPAKWEIGKPIVSFWAGPPMSEAMAKQLAEGGWNLAWGVTVADLDIMHKHGLRGIMWVTIPPQNEANHQRLKWWLDSFRNHPAAYAVHCGDEPGGAKMDSCAKAVDFFIEAAPELLHYNNMFPINASNKQLGHTGTAVKAYAAHIEEYFQKLKPQLLSYDKYHFCFDGDEGSYFVNQAMIRKAALKYNVPSMNIIQGCSWAPTLRVPNGDEYRYLAYTSLAYGSQGISNYVYGHPGHWGSVWDPENKCTTPLYDALKSINREFVAIASELQKVKSLAVWHAGEIPFGVEAMPENSNFKLVPKLENYDQGFEDAQLHYAQGNNFFNRKPAPKGYLLGCFGKDNRVTHLLLVNMDYKKASSTGFNVPAEVELFDQKSGKWSRLSGKKLKLNIAPGSGALLRFADGKSVSLLENNAAKAVVKVAPADSSVAKAKNNIAKFYSEDFTKAKPESWSSNYRKDCSGINHESTAEGWIIRGLDNVSGSEASAILARSFTPVEGDFVCRITFDALPDAQAAANHVEFKLQVPNGETLISAAMTGSNNLIGLVGWNGKIISNRAQGFATRHFTDKYIDITRRGDVYTVTGGKLHGVLSCTGDTSPVAVLSIVLKGGNSSLVIKNIEIRKLD